MALAGVMLRITPPVVNRSVVEVATVEVDSPMPVVYRIYVKGRLAPEMVHLLADLDPVSRS